jgi:hypothetical protein
MSDQMVNVTIQVPEAELTVLRETLRLSKHRQKDPLRFITEKSLPGCVALASSTVDVSSWKDLEAFAGKLGVESPV